MFWYVIQYSFFSIVHSSLCLNFILFNSSSLLYLQFSSLSEYASSTKLFHKFLTKSKFQRQKIKNIYDEWVGF